METDNFQKSTGFSFKNRQNWSNNRFAWFYAAFILVLIVLFGFLLRLAGVYESLWLRIVNLFFIMAGFIILMWDYGRSKKRRLSYVDAFKLCARTGFYLWLIFLPVLLVFLAGDHNEMNLVKTDENFSIGNSLEELVFWNYIEIVGSTLVAGLLASFIAGFGKNKQ